MSLIGIIKYPFAQVRRLKGKIFIAILAMMIFFVMFFPYNELGNLVSNKVSQLTQGQIFLQFDDLDLAFFPQPGIEMTSVYVEMAGMPALAAGSLYITPSISSLLAFRPGFSIKAEEFLNGNVAIVTSQGKSKDGVANHDIKLQAERISLGELQKIFPLPLAFRGNVFFDGQAIFDPTLTEQPEAKIDKAYIGNFELMSSYIQTPMGPLNLPAVKLSKLEIESHLSAGQLYIDRVVLGSEKDELSGSIKGEMALTLVPRGRSFALNPGQYQFVLDLIATPEFEKRFTLLTLLTQYRTKTAHGSRYALKLSGRSFNAPPTMSAF